MFVGLKETGGQQDERHYFASKQIEARIRVPGVLSLPDPDIYPGGAEASYSRPRCYSVSPGVTYFLFKMYETISCHGYGDYSVLFERRNRDIYMKVKAGPIYCYRISPNELQEIQQVSEHLKLYILYKNSRIFKEL